MTPRDRIMQIVPSRISWTPGDPLNGRAVFEYRNAQAADMETVRDLLAGRVSPDVLRRAETRAEGLIRVACRNLLHVGAVAVSLHRPSSNDIRAAYVAPEYRETEVLGVLLDLASLEIPEARTRLWVPEDDSWTQTAVARLGGWRGGYDQTKRYVVFVRRPLARLGARRGEQVLEPAP